VIKSFASQGEEDIFNGINSKQARSKCPRSLWSIVQRKLDQLDSVISIQELKIPPGNQFEKLRGDRKGAFSIRINEKYRICFFWNDFPDEVEIVDYHK